MLGGIHVNLGKAQIYTPLTLKNRKKTTWGGRCLPNWGIFPPPIPPAKSVKISLNMILTS